MNVAIVVGRGILINMRFIDRLEEIKTELSGTSRERLVFMINPKDTRIIEGLVAWKNTKVMYDEDLVVLGSTTLDELWEMVQYSMKDFATCLGITVTKSLKRFRQLRQLNMIFPDGTIDEVCHSLMTAHLKQQLNKILKQ